MADGDPNGVFRRGQIPALYRRRFAPVARPVQSFSRPHRLAVEPVSLAPQRLGRRRFAPIGCSHNLQISILT